MLSIALCCCALFAVKVQAEPAQRIVALSPHLVEQLYSIGVGDRIVGTTDHADYPDAAKNIPRVGNYAQLQVEKILALKPDLVLAWTDGNPLADVNKLRQFGLHVVDSNPLQLTDIAKELRILGQLTGAVDAAEQQALLMEQGLAELRQTYSSKPKVVVFYELWQQPLSSGTKSLATAATGALWGLKPFCHCHRRLPTGQFGACSRQPTSTDYSASVGE